MYMFTVILVYVIHVISQQKEVSVDFLTGMNNRNALIKYLEKLFIKRSELDASFKLMAIGIDDFKNLNNNYGHEAGDRMLITVSDCVKQAAPSTGMFLCRYVRDEFVAVIHEVPEFTIQDYIDRLENKVADVNRIRTDKFELSLSIGYVAYSHDLQNLNSFIHGAKVSLDKQQELKRINKIKESSLCLW